MFPTRPLHIPNPNAVPILKMKRPKTPSPPRCTPPPSTPPTPQQKQQISSNKNKNSSIIPRNIFPIPKQWKPLTNITKSELNLPLTFPTGQTFRFKQTAPFQFTGPIGPHLVSLKHHHDSIYYHFHYTENEVIAREALFDFLNMSVCLREMWDGFKASDERFAELAVYLEGARVLRQDPVECLFQFICSSNNHIKRIQGMVEFLSGKGRLLGRVGEFEFHEFPTLETLALVEEKEFRDAGFGYRAKYIVGTVAALLSKPGGGVEWLASLRKLDLQEAIDGLMSLPGVGPKVAACVALFSLDQHHAIPVDTHVWKIATRYLMPELAGTSLTAKNSKCVADAFVRKYGKYAGWAQTLLFISELPSQKALLPLSFQNTEEKLSQASKRKSSNVKALGKLVNKR